PAGSAGRDGASHWQRGRRVQGAGGGRPGRNRCGHPGATRGRGRLAAAVPPPGTSRPGAWHGSTTVEHGGEPMSVARIRLLAGALLVSVAILLLTGAGGSGRAALPAPVASAQTAQGDQSEAPGMTATYDECPPKGTVSDLAESSGGSDMAGM